MKIFNTENGVDKVYVQLNDIRMLNGLDIPMPASIYVKAYGYSGITVVDDSNRMKFIEYTTPQEIEFFKNQEWIVDYKKAIKLSYNDLSLAIQDVHDEIKEIERKYKSLSKLKQKNSGDLLYQITLLQHKIKDYRLSHQYKTNKVDIDIPLVPDSDGFVFRGDKQDNIYELRKSLEPNKLLLYRKDGKNLTNGDVIPRSWIEAGISISIMEDEQLNEFFGDYKATRYLSEDNKYLIIEFITKEKVKKSKEGLVKIIINKFANKDKDLK